MSTWRQICVWNITRVIRASVYRPRVQIVVKLIIAGFFSVCLLACVSQAVNNTPPLQIDGLVIENQTLMWVSAVRLLVPVTGNFVSCSNISPESSCATTFPETDYTGNPVEITWSQGGQIHSTGQFVIQLPDDLKEERSATVRIVIAGPGSAGAIIVQRPE